MGAKGTRTRENILTNNEINLLKTGVRTLEERVCIYIPLYTGMRTTEIIHMTNDWLDWETDQIRIPENQKCNCYECMKSIRPPKNPNRTKKTIKRVGFWSPKTRAGVRTIPMLPEIFPDLKSILIEVFKEHKIVREIVNCRAQIRNVQNRVATRVGIKRNLFPHAFRGTYAKQLAKSGLDAFEITTALGWDDIKVAMNYIKIFGDELKQSMLKKMKSF
jgi:integrase